MKTLPYCGKITEEPGKRLAELKQACHNTGKSQKGVAQMNLREVMHQYEAAMERTRRTPDGPQPMMTSLKMVPVNGEMVFDLTDAFTLMFWRLYPNGDLASGLDVLTPNVQFGTAARGVCSSGCRVLFRKQFDCRAAARSGVLQRLHQPPPVGPQCLQCVSVGQHDGIRGNPGGQQVIERVQIAPVPRRQRQLLGQMVVGVLPGGHAPPVQLRRHDAHPP